MKQRQLQWLGIAGMIGAPGLWIESSFYDLINHRNTSIGGVFDLLYMIGWMCSIYGFMQLGAAGKKRISSIILYVQLSLLVVANIWNIWEIIDPVSNHPLCRFLDMFWPISNVFMLATGIAILLAKQLSGWQRFTPFIAALWLVITIGVFTLWKDSNMPFYIMNIYSILAWFFMGLAVYTCAGKPAKNITTSPRVKSHLADVVYLEVAETELF